MNLEPQRRGDAETKMFTAKLKEKEDKYVVHFECLDVQLTKEAAKELLDTLTKALQEDKKAMRPSAPLCLCG
jgi:hypothetical protein